MLLRKCSLRAALLDNVEAQGSSADAFQEVVDSIANASRRDVTASRDGYASVDLQGIRTIFGKANVSKTSDTRFPDELGIILRYVPTVPVRRGDTLASIRVNDAIWGCFGEELLKCFRISEYLEYASLPEEPVYG